MTTWVPRFSKNVKAKYLQIVEALEEDLQAGLVFAGMHLPSQRGIAKALAIDVTTVTRALNEANRRGLIESKRGKGSLVKQNPVAGTNKTTLLSANLDLSMNIPPQPDNLQPSLALTINELLLKNPTKLNLSYQDSRGSIADRRAAALWLYPRLGELNLERVLLTAGAQNALASICDTLLTPTGTLCAGEVTYPGLKAVAMNRGLNILPLKIDEYGILPESFAMQCARYAPKALYVIPSLDNPTTATIPEARREQLVALARQYEVQIIEDDPYSLLVDQTPMPFVQMAPERTWHISSLSKCLTPALRIAFVVTPGETETLHLSSRLRANSLMSSPILAAVATHWIIDGTAEKIVAAIKKENQARQSLAQTIMNDFCFAAHQNGHHLWLSLPAPWQAADFASYASHFGLAVVPSHSFAVSEQAPNAVRISLGASADRSLLEQSLHLLVKLMQQPPLTTKIIV